MRACFSDQPRGASWLAVWLLAGWLEASSGTAWSASGNDPAFTVRTNVMVPMRDGVKLAAHVFVPKDTGPFPVLLMRSPYGKGDAAGGHAAYYATRGYAVVNQDCRGKGQSEGAWVPFLNDRDDGLDTLKWILAQSWCNGKIGTLGGSYVGFTQWIMADQAGPALKAMFPVVPLGDPWSEACYQGGAFNLSLALGWGIAVSFKPGEKIPAINWDQAHRELPLATCDEKITGRKIPYLRDWLAHPAFDDYWAPGSLRKRWSGIEAPTFAVGGWYDIFSQSVLENISAIRRLAPTPETRRRQHVMMGPWPHGISRQVGELDFGPQAAVDLRSIEARWFDYCLKDATNGAAEWPPFRIFVMGRNEWRDETDWPLARTRYNRFYFRSGGQANTLDGDGRLGRMAPGQEAADCYLYDPRDPVPTLGGCNLAGCPAGPYDQRSAERRADVLVYTSGVLIENLEATGPVKVILHAATDAADTDWTAKLVDVHPDGRAINLCDGILRARSRVSSAVPALPKPDQVYEYEIDLGVTSNVFLPGHRIRVEISSSNFPRFDRNPNTGHAFGMDAEVRTARQTVYHEAGRASCLVLPVIPAVRAN